MSIFKFVFNNPEYSDEMLNKSISKIIESNELCSIATIKDNDSYIHTAYYCFNKDFDLFFISDPNTQHANNIIKNPSVAVSIYDSHQSWDNKKAGIQIFGVCEMVKGTKLAEGTWLYLKRFTGLKDWIKHPDDFLSGAINSRMFHIKTNSLKLFDEDTFGEEVFISLKIK